MSETVRSLMTADDQLDDIKRAQIWARIDASLDEPVARRSWWPALAVAGAAACVAIAWFALRGRGTPVVDVTAVPLRPLEILPAAPVPLRALDRALGRAALARQ